MFDQTNIFKSMLYQDALYFADYGKWHLYNLIDLKFTKTHVVLDLFVIFNVMNIFFSNRESEFEN